MVTYAHAYFHPGPQDCRDYQQCHGRAYGSGSAAIVALPTDDRRCWLCRKPDDFASVLVSLDGAVRLVCGRCWDRDEVRIPLDEDDE